MAFLEVEDLKVHFPIKGGILRRTLGHIKAVDGVNFKLEQGKTYGWLVNQDLGKQRLAEQLLV